MKAQKERSSMTDYQFPMFSRLEPRTQQFNGGRITSTDVLTLDEAAKFASNHAGTEITPCDFLRASARGEITLRAIVHRTAKLQKHDGGIYCNQGTPTENTAPQGAILNLPLSACKQLAAAGCAEWRTLDDFKHIDGELMRFTVAMLIDGEPDFETVPGDCRVMGDAVHALADEYIDILPAPSGTPETAEPPAHKATPASWIEDVRAIALEYIAKHKAKDLFPSQSDVCGYIEKMAREKKIYGPQGKPVSQSYIQRNAIQGDWWKQNKP